MLLSRNRRPQPNAPRAVLFAVGAVLLSASLSACASFIVADTEPLPPSRLEPAGSEHISQGGYRLANLAESEETSDLLVMVAMSGGGKRSAAFSYGALKGMRELTMQTRGGPRPFLGEIDAIAGVSGGSFTAAYYGLYREAAFGRYETDFLYKDTESNIYGICLLPWNWTWLVDPTVGTNDFMERVYNREMFHDATFADLAKNGRPVIAIGATDISYGTPFLFTQETFDLICSDLDDFPIARAVAASNGFPGLFSPVTLTSHVEQCGGRKPGWLQRVTDLDRRDPLSRVGHEARFAERYLDAQHTRYVHLVDGGVADNLSLRAGGAAMQSISVDGQGGQDPTVAQRAVVGGIFSLFGLVSGAQIDRYNFETLRTVGQQLQDFVAALKRARCGLGRYVDGARCDDVSGALIHVSLIELPETKYKERLLAIPTGLTIKRQDVDLLIEAGRTSILNSAPLRDFLRTYPPEQLSTSSATISARTPRDFSRQSQGISPNG
jgi:NTE family protein